MPNRVEELELTVSELESTVDGLTEELVETKERVRTLEEVLQRELDADIPPRDDEDDAPTREAEPDDVRAAAAEADPEATPDPEPEVEADKQGDADQSDDDGDDSELDDIIVA